MIKGKMNVNGSIKMVSIDTNSPESTLECRVATVDRFNEFANEMTCKYEEFTKVTIKYFKKKKWQNGLRRRK